MDAANLHNEPPAPSTAGPGELVLQNGRQAGARRPLGNPTTFLGRIEGCDIRLNVEGVDPLHCILATGPDGVQLRDLNSVQGTFVNGERIENVLLRHGDLLKVGPFQFRVELTAVPLHVPAEPEPAPIDEARAALRIQAAAVAAQQIALDEEEARLQQRRSDLQLQEEQLAAHLAEKQRQVQLWSEYTKAERETLRKEKIEQDKRLASFEQELIQEKQELNKGHQGVTLERQRINKVYQRLRERWKRQWSAEKAKYQQVAKEHQAETDALEAREEALRAREAGHAQEVKFFNTERELGTRQLQSARKGLEKAQASWRRRRSLECLVLKSKEREGDEAQRKLKQARQLIVQEKDAWAKQADLLNKELHGLNDRILHQRHCLQQQADEIARLDAMGRRRHAEANEWPTMATDTVADAEEVVEGDVVCEADEVIEGAIMEEAPDGWQKRFADLDHLATELTDQRSHLLEQYQRLAEIQEAWQQERDQASCELESLAQRLLEQKNSLASREHRSLAVDAMLQHRQREIETVRQEIQVWRAQLKAREQLFEQEHQRQRLALHEKQLLVQEQLADLASLRQRWSLRRQQELEQMRTHRASIDEQQVETQQLRVSIFEKSQKVEGEKRILAEKALALEQYRQEVFFRANDPAAQSRVERLRRRWLTLNAGLIRSAKAERDAAKKELTKLEEQRAQLGQAMNQLTENESVLADNHALLEEKEATLKIRQEFLEQEIGQLESDRQQSEATQLRMQDEVELVAKAVYDDDGTLTVEQAA